MTVTLDELNSWLSSQENNTPDREKNDKME